ncbi:MAG TPA: hypothetical protein VMG12_05715 [Polyangiaceae bacterium]|nr:hypothetical protein [Polyangiaceae bacterium]
MYGRSLQLWVWGSAFASFVGMLVVLALTPLRDIVRTWFYGMSGGIFVPVALGVAGLFVLEVGTMLVISASDNLSGSDWQYGLKGMLRSLILQARVHRVRESSPPYRYYRTSPEDSIGAVPFSGVGSGCLGAIGLLFFWYATVAVPDELATLSTMFTVWEGGAAGAESSGGSKSSTARASLETEGATGANDVGSDAFGNPIARERSDNHKSLRLRSLGADAEPSADDLCVTSFWHPRVGNQNIGSDEFARAVKGDRLTMSESFEAISSARCSSIF